MIPYLSLFDTVMCSKVCASDLSLDGTHEVARNDRVAEVAQIFTQLQDGGQVDGQTASFHKTRLSIVFFSFKNCVAVFPNMIESVPGPG